MIDQLFGSKTRVKLLKLFYENPNRSFYVREITRKIDEQINSVRRELANLLSIGIISNDTTNNKVFYEVNQKFEHYAALESVFGKGTAKKRRPKKVATPKESGTTPDEVVVEEVAEVPVLDEAMQALGRVEAACLTGQFTRDEQSGVDVLVVGDVNENAVNKYVSDLEQKEGKDLRYAVLSVESFKYRRQINDKFVLSVLSSKKQILADTVGLFA
ncbi:MAG: hypothetical protein QG629_909 [Patescibacteria group bacterium]|nr:transcriptional regulator [Candidatus Saccharibacteria bacterium]MDQ5963826.1 hypothetical protein [Patescibacteria group bacterium]